MVLFSASLEGSCITLYPDLSFIAMKCTLVWLKRDLRLRDHAALAAALETNLPLLLCYFFEPSLLETEMYAPRHWRFVWESLQDMNKRLLPIGGKVHIFHEEVDVGLGKLLDTFDMQAVYAHQETGVKYTFDRDRRVKSLCEKYGITLSEFPQDGVDRGLSHRLGWEKRWETHMNADQVQVDLDRIQWLNMPDELAQNLKGSELPLAFKERHRAFQPGGETYAWKYLQSFVTQRSRQYTPHISKPEFSRKSSSRLSPYLAYGNISARQIHQFVGWHMDKVPHAKMLQHFHERLWWRSHYMQKLESNYRIEWENINRGFDALERPLDPEKYEAWAQGRTGYPMVDASMRCLIETGFMNFRMRAMLATFWCFTLEQPWQVGAEYTARLFLDFEPGIHYAQWQMQAGMSGYHTLRIYNPTTQSQRHDPSGDFVRKWVPELAEVPAPQIYEPWKMTQMEQVFYQCRIGEDYPAPIVQLERAHQVSKDRYWKIRQSPAVQSALPLIWRKHCLPDNVEKYQEAASR